MDFSQLLHALALETKLDLKEAVNSGGCTVVFDKRIELTLEHHNNQVYLFSPVMQITQALPDQFFASLLQIHLFGFATRQCTFGYDATAQRILLFCVLSLHKNTKEYLMEQIKNLVEQAEYWQENLPFVMQSLHSSSATNRPLDLAERRLTDRRNPDATTPVGKNFIERRLGNRRNFVENGR